MRPLVVSLAIIACVPALLAFASPVQAYQHVVNGGFEDGTDGWTPTPGTLFSVDSAAAFEGQRAAVITLDGDGAGAIRASIGALGAGNYAARLAASSQSGSATVRAVFMVSSPAGTASTDIGSVETSSAAWSSLTGNASLDTAGGAVLRIDVNGEPGTRVLIDAVAIDGAPPVDLQPSPTPSPFSSSGGATPSPAATASAIASITPSPTATEVADVIGPALRNPGFEELDAAGLPFAWQNYGGTLTSSSRAREGSRAAELRSETTSTKWLHQAVTVEAGAWYEFSAWILHDGENVSSASLRVAWYTSADATGSQIATGDAMAPLESREAGYRFATTGAIQAPGDAHSARVRILLAPDSDAPARITVDDAWFGAADPPVLAPPTPVVPGGEPRLLTAAGAGEPESALRAPRRVSQARHSPAGPGTGDVVINEVLYDAAGTAADQDAEWIELYNRSTVSVDLAGWTIADSRSADLLPSIIVPPRGFTVIAASAAFFEGYPDVAPVLVLDSRIANGLGNEGDALVLIDPSGRVVDTVSWGDDTSAFSPPVEDVPEGHSIERLAPGVDTDAAADWTDNHRPTPGGPYVATRGGSNATGDARVKVLEGAPSTAFGWLPWAVAGVSLVALAGTAGWRALETARARTQQP